MKIKFFEKDKRYSKRKSGDIIISTYSKGAIRISVKRKLQHLIASDSGYTQVGIYENKMYFKKLTEDKGYKCSNLNSPNYVRVAINSAELFNFAKKYANSYSLLFDSKEELYYISGEMAQQ